MRAGRTPCYDTVMDDDTAPRTPTGTDTGTPVTTRPAPRHTPAPPHCPHCPHCPRSPAGPAAPCAPARS
ncbi:hypothetical protein BU198_06485 [Streptomyces sp. CBMA156]|nr:hypothetical protein [Streptomyces sp. CBMA156]